jgi:arylsulfatase A-like enzyme/lysophospholipase L1-like esterase
MRELLRLVAVVLGLMGFGVFAVFGDERPNGQPPNLVLILLDDVGYSDYGCFGSEIKTPNIDRLAAQGLRFTQFYNNAICLPTRFSLLTGLYPRYGGRERRIQLTPEMLTIGELLQSAGYQTSLSGKWHLGAASPHRPIDRGFGEFFGMLDGCSNHFDPSIPDPPFEGGRLRVWARNAERLAEFPKDFYSSDAIADHAIENIRRSANAGQPFFAHVCFTAAHSPLHAQPADVEKYRSHYSIGWDEVRRRRRERQLELGITNPIWKVAPREPEVNPWNAEPFREWNENLMAVYAAMVDSIDQNIGRILQAVEQCGAGKNTLVLVLNDNGGCAEQAGGDDPTNIAGPKECYVSCGAGWAYAQNTPFRRYKGWVHEGGIATPLIAYWPSVIRAGKSSEQVGHVIDLLPTLADVAGVSYPTERSGRRLLPLEGRSLLSVLRGEGASLTERDAICWKAFDNRAVRQGRWKLVRDMNVGRWELYDVTDDRTETRDLADRYPERLAQLTAIWNSWAERTGAAQETAAIYTLKRVPENLPPIKIALIGDSTVASYVQPPADRPTLTGWGQVFGLYFQDAVEISNHAVSGRSSKSFLGEGRWQPVLAEKPNYVFIQFGHNDQPGKGDRTTDPDGDFQNNLRKYIDDAREAGAVPILVTPVARRTFENGKARTTLTPYADAMKRVGRERMVAVVDLHAASFDLYNERGDEATSWFSPSSDDRTHFSRRGAIEVARLVALTLPLAAPPLRHYMRQPWQVPNEVEVEARR